MTSVGHLKDKHTGQTAFVVGNGASRRWYDLGAFRRLGLILGCNKAYHDFKVDYLNFRDDDVMEDGLAFEGPKITHENVYSGQFKHLVGKTKHLYTYSYRQGNESTLNIRKEKKLSSNQLGKGSSGFMSLQLARLMGCDPIVLIGCDCELLPGETSYSLTYDDTKQCGLPVRYNNFLNQLNWMVSVLIEEGRRVFKLGALGRVDAPVCHVEDLIKKEKEHVSNE
jgi:hypothetical protein